MKRSPLDCKEILPVHSEGDQPWVFFGRNDAKAETPVLWSPHAKSWLIGKDSDARRDWGQEEKGTTEDEMAGWHHWLSGRESEWTLGVGDGQGGLACCDSWGREESDTTERLNWTELTESYTKNKKAGMWNSIYFLEVCFTMSWKENIYIKKEEQTIVRLTKFGRGKSKKERVEKRKATHSSILAWRIPWTI